MYKIMRLNGASPGDPAVDAWLNTRPAAFQEIARHWFCQMRACGPDVVELIHDGCPVACVEDAPFAYVNVFTDHINVGFFHGASLPDPSGMLQGTGKYMRHVKIKTELVLNESALQLLIKNSYLDIQNRLKQTGS